MCEPRNPARCRRAAEPCFLPLCWIGCQLPMQPRTVDRLRLRFMRRSPYLSAARNSPSSPAASRTGSPRRGLSSRSSYICARCGCRPSSRIGPAGRALGARVPAPRPRERSTPQATSRRRATRCPAAMRINTFEKLGVDGRKITGLAYGPSGKGKLVTIADSGWSVKAGKAIKLSIGLNATGKTLLSKFGRTAAPSRSHRRTTATRSAAQQPGSPSNADYARCPEGSGADQDAGVRASASLLLWPSSGSLEPRGGASRTTRLERRRWPSGGNDELPLANRGAEANIGRPCRMPSLGASCRLHNAARLRLVTRFLPVTLFTRGSFSANDHRHRASSRGRP